ncbi:MAG: pyridoxine 5-phosphate synthase [Burkholderiaceae bacterium]|jgi:pyridoxine 5-phosphate synthase
MTQLSVNINKIALLRNSRGRNYPDVCGFAERFLQLGADGITLHPRPDQRHARYADVVELHAVTSAHGKELNVEGYPTAEFLEVVRRTRPAQCTLVPDSPDQITSDHGWDLVRDADFLRPVIAALNGDGIRVSLFIDVNNLHLPLARELGADRIELYTEPYAETFGTAQSAQVLGQFREAATRAALAGLGVNAGHDLSLENLADFLTIPDILEVSIGHALIVECLELGLPAVLARYVALVGAR